MENIVKNLTKIASNLDERKQVKFASQIDKFADRLVHIKTAQYVGIQGYWVRNERCWSNCYRQKRAKSPDTPSQVIWQECQNEYVDSINNPVSGWEKYADDTSLKKFASKHQKELIKMEREYFDNAVKEKVAKGMTQAIAVYDTVEQRKAAYINEQIDLGNSMLEFAEKLKKGGFAEEAQKVAAEAKEIVKEAAGFWGNFFSGLKGEGQVYQQAQAIFVNNIAALTKTLQQFQGSPEVAFPQRNKFAQQMQTTIRNLQGFLNKAKGISGITSRGVWELTTDFMNRAIPVATAISNAADVNAFSQAVGEGLSVLNSFVADVPEKIEQQVEILEGQQVQVPDELQQLQAAIRTSKVDQIIQAISALPSQIKDLVINSFRQIAQRTAAQASRSDSDLIKESKIITAQPEAQEQNNIEQVIYNLISNVNPGIAQQVIRQMEQPKQPQQPQQPQQLDVSGAISQIHKAVSQIQDPDQQVAFVQNLIKQIGFDSYFKNVAAKP